MRCVAGRIKHALARNRFIPIHAEALRGYRRGARDRRADSAGRSFALTRRRGRSGDDLTRSIRAPEESDNRRLWAILAHLPPTDSEVLQFALGLDGGDGRSLQDVADITGIKRCMCHHIKNRALRKLRAILTKEARIVASTGQHPINGRQ
jgi:DNA-directed RNA polymerase specialized sigma24 family protein